MNYTFYIYWIKLAKILFRFFACIFIKDIGLQFIFSYYLFVRFSLVLLAIHLPTFLDLLSAQKPHFYFLFQQVFFWYIPTLPTIIKASDGSN